MYFTAYGPTKGLPDSLYSQPRRAVSPLLTGEGAVMRRGAVTTAQMHIVVQSCPVYAAQESRTASSTELYYSYERTRTTVTAALCKKLKDLMAEFQALRLRLADEHRQASPVVMHGTCFVCQTCTLHCNRVLSFFTAVVRIQAGLSDVLQFQ